MALNQDKQLFLEWIGPLFVRGFPLPPHFVDDIVCKWCSSPLIRWLWIGTKACCWHGFVPHLFKAIHCHSFSDNNIGCKCSSSLFIRWLWIRTRNCCWHGFIHHSFEAVHCHPSSIINIGGKCSSIPLMRWLWITTSSCFWNEFVR